MGATILDIREVRLKATRHGLMLYNSKDSYIGRSFDLYGEFSEGEVNLFRQLVATGDGGARHRRQYRRPHALFRGAVGPGGRVIAYEPQRVIHQMLCANLALNGITNVQRAACGSRVVSAASPACPSSITRAHNNFGGISLGTGGPSEPVDIIPVDALGLERCDFMKIDVEGMEGEVLAGATSTIARFRPVLYVENDRREKSAPLIEQLLSFDYELFWHVPLPLQPAKFLWPDRQRVRQDRLHQHARRAARGEAQRPRASAPSPARRIGRWQTDRAPVAQARRMRTERMPGWRRLFRPASCLFRSA